MEVEVKIKDYEIDFEKATSLANSIASNFGEAMLLSWCDYKRGVRNPDVECCGENSWEIYAKNRGGNLKIKINEDYAFMFRIQ
ncbi:AF1514 family protein [Archaeoglobus veneficus]|uniref:DUF5619 domain-containing protein n=1 Tax=Archaeoglobus veneficus (strain DSM 11195 / SNP6) TaxID=693661 RepID=F2KQU2_ARCVS|nr:AF1514 family protein [Archaeoglobus veneficus]AEA46654.1 hypothetical protein Arcve_0633 [Archaeoglobus veneficus SNP6]